MSHAIRVHEYGGPEVLKWEKVAVGAPGPGEVKIKQTAIGLNYIDVYTRTGLYPQSSLPFVPGMEGAGVVTEVGEGVRDLKVGRRVAYAGSSGAYAEERLGWGRFVASLGHLYEEVHQHANVFRR